MKASMLTRLVFGLIVVSVVFGGGVETASSFEGWSLSALILALITEIAGAYLEVSYFSEARKEL